MSRHSKWAKIKHDKGASDAKRGQLFTKFGRAISVAAKQGPDPATNFRLRMAIDAARAGSMPKDTIERAISRGSGVSGEVQIEEVLYEGFGPGGAAVIIEGTSDNKNRTTANIRHLFDKHGGKLGASGSVVWMFERRGVIRVARPSAGADELALSFIDLGALDVREEDSELTVFVAPEKFESVKQGIEKKEVAVAYAEAEYLPRERLTITDAAVRAKLEVLVLALDEDDDVQNVFTNTDI